MSNQFLTTRTIKLSFDATDGKAIGTHSLAGTLPSGAIVKSVFYDVTTTFTSSTDAATIALQVQSAGDAVAAIAISAAGNVYDAGLRGTLLGSPAVGSDASTLDAGTSILYAAKYASSILKLTADRTPAIVVAVEALTAGVMDVYIEYSV